MKHVKLLLALIVVVLIGISTSEIVLAQGKKKPTSKIPVKTERPAAKRTPQPKQEKKRNADETPRKVVERKPQQEKKREAKPQPKQGAKQSKRSADEIINAYVNSMVYVEGGTFTMGATSEQGGDAYDWEKPAHSVTLSSYYMGETEVTQALWEAVMGSNPSNFKGANRPVEQVSWDDCQEFISRLNAKTGKRFRLPTEAEWEYAARGGHSGGYKYSGSDNIYDVAWFDKNIYDKGSSSPHYGTYAVATKLPNELGLYDMSGNVQEWCSDWYGTYSSSAQSNPTGPSSGSSRVCRGGSWFDSARYCRVSIRYYDSPDSRCDFLGFRLAL